MKAGLVVGQDAHRAYRKIQVLSLLILIAGVVLALLPAPGARACLGRGGEQPPFLSYPNQFNVYPLSGNVPTVMILIENPQRGVSFSPALRNPAVWSARLTEINNYFDEVSGHRFHLVPATETYGTLNDGIIGPISVPDMQTTTTTSNYYWNIADRLLAPEAAQLASQYINFAMFDKNLDGMIGADELHIIFVQAGYERSYDTLYTPMPNTWMHSTSWDTPVSNPWMVPDSPYPIPGILPIPKYWTNNVYLSGYTYLGAEFFTPGKVTMTTLGPFVHELAHDMGIPDLDTPSGNYGLGNLGYHSLMSMGQWGGGDGSLPVHLDAYNKLVNAGWANPTVVTAPTNKSFTLPATYGSNAMVRINPPQNPNGEYFLVENRQHMGYDAGLPGTQGGLAIYHINPNYGSTYWTSGTLGFRGAFYVTMEKADGMTTFSALNYGSDRDYFRLGYNQLFNALTIPNSNLDSGLPSQVAISSISASGPSMTFSMSHDIQVGFASRFLNVGEAQGGLNVLVGLNQPSDSLVTVDYSASNGSAVNGIDYNLSRGTLSFLPGETAKYFNIGINNDALATGNKMFWLNLYNPQGAILNTTTSMQMVTILDNDNPFLNVAKPNGGEVIERGNNIKVEWITNPVVVGDQVNIDLLRNGNYYMTLKYRAPNTSNRNYNTSATVFIPATLPVGFNYQIQLTSLKDSTYNDKSDGYFSIIDGNLKITNLTINSGAGSTPSRTVTLNLTVPSTVTPAYYMASESPAFAGAKWLPYSANPQYTLTKGDGFKRVFVKISKDGQESAPVNAAIKLYEVPTKPQIQVIPDALAIEHQPYVGPVPLLLVGDRPVIWSLVSGPAGLLINPATGAVTWKDPNQAESPATIRIRATNAVGYGDMSWKVSARSGDLALALNNTQLAWSTSGDAGWNFQTQYSHDGQAAARSNPLANGKKAVLSTTVTGPGLIGFWWKVSSEANYDTLSFTVGNFAQGSISGDKDWTYMQVPVPVGKFTLRWTYAKDGQNTARMDAGFVDQVTWQPAMQVTGLTRAGYVVDAYRQGVPLYGDSKIHAGLTVPFPLFYQSYIRTLAADSKSKGASLFSFNVDQPVNVVLAIDSRFPAPPSWAQGYTKLPFTQQTSAAQVTYYSKTFPAGKITLGGNSDNGNPNGYQMYNVILVPTAPAAISNLNQSTYSVMNLKSGLRVTADGTGAFLDPLTPLYAGATTVRTRQTDRANSSNALLSFDVTRPVTVLVGFDARMSAPPTWAMGWQYYGDQVNASDGARKLYARRFTLGRITLGGNVNPGETNNYNMYTVIVLPSN